MPAFCNKARVRLPARGVIKWATAASIMMLLVLFVSLSGVALGETERPVLSASEPTLFKGEMAKGINIQMKLKSDGSNLYGTYLYEMYGHDIEVKGTINESGEFALQEFVKGKNTGSFRGRFVSKERIEGRWFRPGSDKGRAFFLVTSGAAGTVPAGKDPVVAAAEVPKAQAPAPRSVAKEQSQSVSQPVKSAPQPAPAPEAARSVAAPAPKAQPERSASKPIPVVQELPLAQQEGKPKTPVEPARPDPEPVTKAPGQPKQVAKEETPPTPVPIAQETPRSAEPGAGESQDQNQEKPRVAGRAIDAVSTKNLPPWVSLILNLRVLAVFGGILLLGGGLAWLAIVAGGMAGFRDNSALFRKAYSRGFAFLPGVFLLALGVGAILAVFVE